ncbi:type II secretion system protein [Marinobacter confluentis]|uniref:Type II secretion system protein n=1 Tax=Marinobacter confluentis TaxID=1697557 RepID=A0A4Z1C5P2_9GAMM|nr:type II secretion system protein [Marinobacter confluentis]TGN38542.1 type II secretion system protein [Marinobacter confluentis]
MKTVSAPRSSGFTLVELVMVIILIGVLSVLGIGLFAGRSAFSPILATQQLASATLLAQQAALAGNAGGSLTISQDSENFTFTVGAGALRVFSMPREGTSLAVAGGLPFTIDFDASGAPVSGTNTSLTFSGESSFQTCISSLGAVYRGSCQ